MFVCILRKCSKTYFILCVWSNIKQNNKKKLTPKTTEINQKWEPPPRATPQPTTSHPATHRERNPHRNRPKNHHNSTIDHHKATTMTANKLHKPTTWPSYINNKQTHKSLTRKIKQKNEKKKKTRNRKEKRKMRTSRSATRIG